MNICPKCSNENTVEERRFADPNVCSYWIYRVCQSCNYDWPVGAVHAPYIPEHVKPICK